MWFVGVACNVIFKLWSLAFLIVRDEYLCPRGYWVV